MNTTFAYLSMLFLMATTNTTLAGGYDSGGSGCILTTSQLAQKALNVLKSGTLNHLLEGQTPSLDQQLDFISEVKIKDSVKTNSCNQNHKCVIGIPNAVNMAHPESDFRNISRTENTLNPTIQPTSTFCSRITNSVDAKTGISPEAEAEILLTMVHEILGTTLGLDKTYEVTQVKADLLKKYFYEKSSREQEPKQWKAFTSPLKTKFLSQMVTDIRIDFSFNIKSVRQRWSKLDTVKLSDEDFKLEIGSGNSLSTNSEIAMGFNKATSLIPYLCTKQIENQGTMEDLLDTCVPISELPSKLKTIRTSIIGSSDPNQIDIRFGGRPFELDNIIGFEVNLRPLIVALLKSQKLNLQNHQNLYVVLAQKTFRPKFNQTKLFKNGLAHKVVHINRCYRFCNTEEFFVNLSPVFSIPLSDITVGNNQIIDISGENSEYEIESIASLTHDNVAHAPSAQVHINIYNMLSDRLDLHPGWFLSPHSLNRIIRSLHGLQLNSGPLNLSQLLDLIDIYFSTSDEPIWNYVERQKSDDFDLLETFNMQALKNRLGNKVSSGVSPFYSYINNSINTVTKLLSRNFFLVDGSRTEDAIQNQPVTPVLIPYKLKFRSSETSLYQQPIPNLPLTDTNDLIKFLDLYFNPDNP